ncbi:6-pyruvoyl tetrahydropterin synthase [compost metagenome]
MTEAKICKIFTFDSAHQLIGHNGKCSNVHGHTYKLEVVLKGQLSSSENSSNEGFVMDFSDVKKQVKHHIIDPLDHAFIASGNEPVVHTLQENYSKVAVLGFRTTAENMCMYICHTLRLIGLPVWSIKLWETPTSWAEVFASEIPASGPSYSGRGDCDNEQ